MVIAVHFVFTTYGFWLPNDPRGSGSMYVGLRDLYRQFGAATKVSGTKSVAGRSHDRAARLQAKSLLPREPVSFTGIQARAVARGIAAYCDRSAVPVYAFTVLPRHVHMVTGYHRLSADSLLSQFKVGATRQLRDEELWGSGTPWGRGGWHRYIDSPQQLIDTLKYVRDNPGKEGLPPQNWGFVQDVPRHLWTGGSAPLRVAAK